MHRVSPGLFASLRMFESCEAQHNCGTIFRVATAFLSSLSLPLWNCSLSLAFCSVVHQHNDAGTNTYTRLCSPILLCKIDTWEDANTHKAIACKHLSNNICTVVEEWHHVTFCLGYFFSSTHFDLVSLMAQKVWRHCGLLLCTIVTLMPETALVSFRTLAFFFPLATSTFSSSTPISPIRFLTTAPVPILPCLASKFRNRSF